MMPSMKDQSATSCSLRIKCDCVSKQRYNDGERMDLGWKMTTNWQREGTISGYNQQAVVTGGGDLTANFLPAEKKA